MHSLPQEFLALCRQLGEAQDRCSAAMAAQARQIDALQADVVRLRGAVVLRDTRLALAQEALQELRHAAPQLPRRKAMAQHITGLLERIATLSRECLRWRLAAQSAAAAAAAPMPGPAQALALVPDELLDADLAAADLVICQTGCISHADYWRVQDHCRRTGKPCLLVDQPLALREAQALAAIQPMVVLRTARSPRALAHAPAATETAEAVALK